MFRKLLPILLLTGCLDSPYECQVAVNTETNRHTEDLTEKIDSQLTKDTKMKRPESLVSMFRSEDGGRNWTPMGDGLPEDLQVSHLDTLGKQIVLASMNYGVFLSDLERQRWHQLDTLSLPSKRISSLYEEDGNIYVGVYKQGIYVSNNVGKNWVPLNHNLKDETVKSILRNGKELWIGTEHGIFALQDGAETWRQVTDKPQMWGLLKAGDKILAGSYKGILSSSDNGATWSLVNHQIKPSKLSFVEGKIIAMDWEEGLAISEDLGKTWKPIQAGVVHENHVFEIVRTKNNLMRSQTDGIYMSKDWGKSWKDIYHFSFSEPFGVMLSIGSQWNEVYSRPEAPFIELLVLDGVVYGATVRGC